MKRQGSDDLAIELRQAGADEREIPALMSVAAQLGELSEREPVSEPAARPKNWLLRLTALPVASCLAGLTVGVAIVVFSQSVLPDSWLFPVQKLSDETVTHIRPQYRATVMMKRAQQVNGLAAKHADSKSITSALKDYETEAKEYGAMPDADYSALEFCEINLEEAAKVAPPDARKQIEATLRKIEAE